MNINTNAVAIMPGYRYESCQLCGSNFFTNYMYKLNGTETICHSVQNSITREHILPKSFIRKVNLLTGSKIPVNDNRNICLTCAGCNTEKRDYVKFPYERGDANWVLGPAESYFIAQRFAQFLIEWRRELTDAITNSYIICGGVTLPAFDEHVVSEWNRFMSLYESGVTLFQ